MKIVIRFLFLFPCTFSFSQINGTVQNIDGQTVSNAIIKLVENDKVLKYTFSDKNGDYTLETPKEGNFLLVVSTLNYDETIVEVKVTDRSLNYSFDLVLIPKDWVALDEAIILAEKPIVSRGDTIIFDAKYFAQGNEDVLEDLLKKIPGLNIDSEGTIKVGDQEIEKVMIEGDDFFERGYKILTKNMPIHPIEKIELLQNFSDNKHLKGIEESNKVALNIRLSKDAKRQWFGNLKAGMSDYVNQRYQLQTNLMSFGKRNKYYFLTHLNNIGVEVAGDIEHLVKSNSGDFVGNGFTATGVVSMNPPQLLFKNERYNFNNAELVSLNAILNPSEKLKIQPMLFLQWDEKDFFRKTTSVYHLPDNESFTNEENYKLRNKKFSGFGKLNFQWELSENQTLESTTKFNKNKRSANSEVLFNENLLLENLDEKPSRFDQEIQFTQKISEQKAIILQGRFIQDQFQQNFLSNVFLFDYLISDSSAESIYQKTNNKGKLWGFSAQYFDRRTNGNLWEIKLTNTNEQWNWTNNWGTAPDTYLFEDFNNQKENQVSAKTAYLYKISEKFYLRPELTIGNIRNHYQTFEKSSDKNWNYISPALSVNWKPGKKDELLFSFQQNRNSVDNLQVHSNFIVSRYNLLSQGLFEPNTITKSSYFLNYTHGKFTDNLILNHSFFYTHNHDYISQESIVTQDYILNKSILLKDQNTFGSHTTLDYYLKKLKSNIKFKLNYFSMKYESKVNDSEFRDVISNNWRYGMEFRTAFRGDFNFHLGTEFSTISLKTDYFKNSYTQNISFLNTYINLSEKWDLQTNFEYYNFGKRTENRNYYFLDVISKYQIDRKLNLSVYARNLFNTQSFTNQSISDISISSTTYRLIPRYIMLAIEYKF